LSVDTSTTLMRLMGPVCLIRQGPRAGLKSQSAPPYWQRNMNFASITRMHGSALLRCVRSDQQSLCNNGKSDPCKLTKRMAIANGTCVSFCTFWPHLGTPWGNRGKCHMDRKRIQCLSNALQHVPIYLQSFPVIFNP